MMLSCMSLRAITYNFDCINEQRTIKAWIFKGGGVTSVYVRLCPVLFGFYETTDVVFGTLADIDGHWRTWTDIGGHRRTLADLDGHWRT